jgi:hypothetical protein
MSCRENEHNFEIAKRNYYKYTGQVGGLGLPTTDQSVAFSMLFCTKCGDTKEIIASDHRKTES